MSIFSWGIPVIQESPMSIFSWGIPVCKNLTYMGYSTLQNN